MLLVFLSRSATAAPPGGLSWFTIATPHFRVHHTKPLESYARALAQAFEQALPELEQRLSWKAPEAVDVVVTDSSDNANGLAMNFPNTHIELYASPFAADSALAFYIDWPSELAIHELTHIVANDTTLGAYRIFRTIFGSWVKPNGLQPTWLSEGLAVFQESSLTNGGRGRSPLLDALLREAVLENKLNDPSYTSLDRFNDTVPWWPGGNTPYLLGYSIQALPNRTLPNFPGRFSFENAGNLIFSPSEAIEKLTGQDWASIWSHATDQLERRYEQNPLPRLECLLTHSGRHTGGHALSADGWIYFSEEDWNHGYHLARVRGDSSCINAKIERLSRKPFAGPSQVAVSPDGKTVAYAAQEVGYEFQFTDLFLWREEEGAERLTRDERARDPAFAGNDILFFVKANADTSESIVELNLSTKQSRVRFTSRPLEKISSLAARDKHVVFSFHQNQGHEKIFLLGVNGKAIAILPQQNAEREFERNPFLASDGSVFFSASYGYGPLEIYRARPGDQKPGRVLAARSGYLDRPVLSDNHEIFVEQYGLGGIDLARTEWKENAPGLPEPKEDLHQFLSGEARTPLEITPPPKLLASTPYSAFASPGTSLWPQYWFPELNFATDGALLGASTSGNDPLEYHKYYASMQYDTRATFPVYRAYYHNRVLPVDLHFEAEQTNSYFLSTKKSNRNAIYTAEAMLPWRSFAFSLGGGYQQKSLFGVRTSNYLIFQNTRFDRAGKTPAAISPNWGATFNNFIAYYPASSFDEAFADFRPQLHLFFRGFHPAHSVSLAAQAGITTNRSLALNYYQGGGPSSLDDSYFIVRGFPNDALFGQKIATANFAYTLPIAHPYRGINTMPVFLSSLGLRFLADAGTANYTANYNGGKFSYYEWDEFGRHVLFGTGIDFLAVGSIFYHVPITTSLGAHYGANKRYGGGAVLFLGIDIGLARLAAQ